MFKRETYRLVLKGDTSEYICGKIVGVIIAVTNSLARTGSYEKSDNNDCVFITFDATKHQLNKILDFIARRYYKRFVCMQKMRITKRGL